MRANATTARLAVLLLAGAPLRAAAHDGPEHEIELLTARMRDHGETAELLAERAVEYRVLGKLAEATRDLERAASLDPDSTAVHRQLGRVLFLAGKSGEAIESVTRGLRRTTGEPADVASLRILRAEVLRSQKEYVKALDDCNAALQLHTQNPEWYLLRSDLQKRLKMHKQRIEGIEAGINQTGAGVLEIERIEALLDAGEFEPALSLIETELRDSRIKSSWLIRRGRALLGLGRKTEAEANLRAAIDEIETRLNPKTPDVPLLLDKALARDLLGEKKEALRTYEQARDKGAGDSLDEKIKALQ